MNLQGRDLKLELIGDDVRLLHAELAQINLPVPAAEQQRAFFGPGTRDAIARFQKDHRLRVTGVVDATTAKAINAAVAARTAPTGATGHPTPPAPPAPPTHPSPPAPPPVEPLGGYVVEGSVTSRYRAAFGGLEVRVVDKNPGPDVELARTAVDDRGRYRVTFSAAPLRARKKDRPDLQARVFAGGKNLGDSAVHYDATSSETIDVRLPDDVSGPASEHEALTGALAAHFPGRLRDLKEDDERQDITYLANKTGWDARAVALGALADQASDRAGGSIPAAAFYALFRAGLPTDEDALYRTDASSVEKIWKKSSVQGIIPSALRGQVPALVERFRTTAVDRLLAAPARVGISSLAQVLAESPLDAAQQRQFAELYASNRGDLPAFWAAAGRTFGQETAERLKVDGKLAYLTINNAPLIAELHRQVGGRGLSDPRDLVSLGYHRAQVWDEVLARGIDIPPEVPGMTALEKRANYAGYLASQVRLAYPTAAVADLVKSGELTSLKAPEQVRSFLDDQKNTFEIGVHPVEQYIADRGLAVSKDAIAGLKALQRVYQITPDDKAMTGLLNHGIDAAYHVVRYTRPSFVETFAADLGGADAAGQTWDKAVQVHHAVLNVAISYLTASNAPGIGVHSPAQVIDPLPPAAHAGDVLAYSTLEDLFGSLDFCACQHCRSILSPAAYLVDLLMFTNQPTPPVGTRNPQVVLEGRRPDLFHLPLTCENTNTVLPYIDLVNETLEYFIANGVQKMSLTDFAGHDTGDVATEDLLASPQYVMDTAYTTLRDERFPPPLPFHQPLESLRRYFAKFESTLPKAMEQLRKADALERGANPYGWRDILMERAGFSRAEYEILTDSGTVPLWRLFGFANGTSDAAVIAELSNARAFCRRVGITYENLVTILRTRFVNPNNVLLPKLDRLGVEFVALDALHRNPQGITGGDFNALLPQGGGTIDVTEFGGDAAAWEAGGRNTAPIIRAWLNSGTIYDQAMGLLTLVDPTGAADPCNFGALELRFSKPMAAVGDVTTRLGASEFVRLLRFVRLWKKTGWTIEQVDSAICALFRADCAALVASDVDTIAKLDAGFALVVPRIGVLRGAMEALGLDARRALLPLLACWAPIGTHGAGALYRQLFLNPALVKDDPAFTADANGAFLADNTRLLADHVPALRAACNLTGDEYDRIIQALGFVPATPLTLPNVTAIYRVGWLSRALRLSVAELLLLVALTDLAPFSTPDLTAPAILTLIQLVQALKARSMKTSAALYLVWNHDLSGRSAPAASSITELARLLRGDFAAIEDQFAATEDPGGDVARARMTLVYGQEASDAFFALLDDTITLDVPYTHGAATLEAPIVAADARIGYDDFRHRLSHQGVMRAGQQGALNAVAGVTPAFQQAVDEIFARSEDVSGSFFTRYPELQPLFAAYVASVDPPEVKRRNLLAAFRPELARRRKRQQALQRLGTAAGVDEEQTRTLVDPSVAPGAPYPLHAAGQPNLPAMSDVLAIETSGLSAEFHFRDTATGAIDLTIAAVAVLEYAPGGTNSLPANPTPGAAVSGVWRGALETPESGYYNIVIEADDAASVTLSLDGTVRPLVTNGAVRRNANPLELNGGALHDVAITVERVKDVVSVKWETPKRPRQVIPERFLYPPSILDPFSNAYVRFLKATAIAAGLRLSPREISHFATHADYRIGGVGWLNLLPVTGAAIHATEVALLAALQGVLEFARLKSTLAPDSDALVEILEDPASATAAPDSDLYLLTGWNQAALTAVRSWFGVAIADLASLKTFARVFDALALCRQLGVAAETLLPATTNEPTADIARAMESALRARYAPADWREAARPINDELRGLQRDALVAYILHQMGSVAGTAHINTPDKLFEYFLMDVQMEPCTQTSRIRNALSSVQLFIERCLMNLEHDVSPAALNAAQWEWMKRYRVWEANRKVFLFPENWLEGGLRDDKSPFFKEIESELLQSDITEDSAAGAMMTYLSKLEEVAKLEPCGIFRVPGDEALRTEDVDHVIARTAGAHRKYYYRRRELGYWTPWEQIKLDIEDNPAIPVVWKGRLLLVWLRIMKQGQDTAQKPPTGTGVTSLTTSQLPSEPFVRTQASLSWSEYYQGKWQPVKTSDVSLPTEIRVSKEVNPQAFKRNDVTLSVGEEDGGLRIGIFYQGQFGRRSSFLLHNTHSLPIREEDRTGVDFGLPEHLRYAGTVGETFILWYVGEMTGAGWGLSWEPQLTREVLTTAWQSPRIVEPMHESVRWGDPFFYEDSRHAFFVTTTDTPVWISDYPGYSIDVSPAKWIATKIPDIVPKVDPRAERIPYPPRDGGPVVGDPRVTDPASVNEFLVNDTNIRLGLATTASVKYGERVFRASGAIPRAGAGR